MDSRKPLSMERNATLAAILKTTPSDAALAAASTDTHDLEWQRRSELIRKLVHAARGPELLSGMLMCVLVVLGWGRVPSGQLLGWFGLGVGVAACRLEVERLFQRRSDPGGLQQQQFIQRYSVTWIVSGAVWGLAGLIFFGRSPVPVQLICWLIVAGVAAYSVHGLALHPPLVRHFLFALSATVLASISFRIVQQEFESPSYLHGFMLLSLLQWVLLLRVGAHVFEVHRDNYELQLHNRLLLNSLSQQRQAALTAVTTVYRLLASATHDMRQPVLALSLYAEWLRNEPEAVHEIAPKIVGATNAVNALFEALFDLARFDANPLGLRMERIDLNHLLRDLELQHRPVAEAKRLEFRVYGLAGDLRSDPAQVRRMLGNLLSNAIKYTETGGVLLAVRRTKKELRVEIWDTGIGIAAEHLNDVFLEFYKVPDDVSSSDGFGLGLAIVARLSDALGHPVAVRSRRHRGSVFSVTFPGAGSTGNVGAAQEVFVPTAKSSATSSATAIH